MNIVKIDEMKKQASLIQQQILTLDASVAEVATSVKSAMETKKLLAYLVDKIEMFKNDLDLYREGKEIEIINPQEIMMKFLKKNFDKGSDGFGDLPKFP